MDIRKLLLFVFLPCILAIHTGCLGPIYGLYEFVLKEEPPEESNSSPVILIDTIGRQYDEGNISVGFTLSDPDRDSCRVTVYYSVAGGAWTQCTGIAGIGGKLQAAKGGKSYSGTWDATGDLGTGTTQDVTISITANDGKHTSRRAISDIFITGNEAPSITIIDPASIEAGNIILEYTVSDSTSDDVDLTCEYSTDGMNFFPMTIAAGETSNITTSAGGEVHTIVWASNSDIAGANEGSVLVKIRASDGEPASGEDTTGSAFQVKNNISSPIAVITQFDRSFSADVHISYKLVDTDGGTASITPKYSTDGSTWLDATEKTGGASEGTTGLSMSADGDMHVYVWDSANDIGTGLKTGIYFKVIPNDGGGPGVAGETGPFSIGNDAPGVDISDPSSPQSGNIVINYTLTDSTDDDCTVTFQYGESATGPWSNAAPAIGTNPETDVSAKSGGSAHTFVWNSSADYPGVEATVYFKITAEDGGAFAGNHVSGSFNLDNTTSDSAPVVVISTVSRQFDAANIPIQFNLSDSGDDDCDIIVYYQVASGGWTACTGITGNTTGLDAPPGGQDHSLTWDATGDIGSGTVPDVEVSIIANDGTVDSLRGVSNAFISGNDAPSVNIIDPEEGQEGDIVVDYTLTDPASDTCTITVQYQIDGEGTWNNCTSASIIPNPQAGVASSDAGINYSFMWDTLTDLGAVAVDVWVRVKADDGAPSTGYGVTSSSFIVDNNTANQPPSVTFISSLMVLNDTYAVIPVLYRLYDPEEDVCSIILEYSTDGGTNWYPCTEYPEKCSEGKTGLISYKNTGEEEKGDHVFFWNSTADVLVTDVLTDIRIKAKDINGNGSWYVYKLIPCSNGSAAGLGSAIDIQAEGWDAATGDINGDGYDDIVIAGNIADGITICYGSKSGHSSPQFISGGTDPRSITTGDINGDGYADIVCANEFLDDITVSYGSATGHGTPQTISAGNGPCSITTGDINGDGYADIVCANKDSNNITISYGSATGHGTPQTISAGTKPYSITTGDVNGDGYADIVCANNDSDDITISYGSGTGHGTPQTISAGNGPRSITTGDINGDGYADIVCANTDITVSYGSGTGHGTPQTISAGSLPYSITTGDINGDGYADIACANIDSDDITVSYGSTTGHGAPQTIPAGTEPYAITTGDINGDGYADIVCANQTSGDITVSCGSNAGHSPPLAVSIGGLLQSIATGDVNGDGYADIVCRGSICYGSSAGHQEPDTAQAGDQPCSIATGDINRDGYEDVVNIQAKEINIYYGSAKGYTSPQTIGFTNSDGLASVILCDIDGNGYADIACANSGTGTSNITVSYGSASGHGSPQTISAGQDPMYISAGDINGDGYADIVCANRDSYDITISYGSSTGHGTPQTILAGDDPRSITTGDINGDGYADIVCVNYASNDITVSYGSGTGHGSPQTISAGTAPHSVTTGDINGDGYADIVCSNFGSDDITISYGSASGPGSPQTIPSGENIRFIATGDINGDGYADIAGGGTNGYMTVIYGSSKGPTPPEDILTGNHPWIVTIGDVNGDGYEDILTGDFYSDSIFILYGSRSGATIPEKFSSGNCHKSVATGDVNGDGYTDVVYANQMSSNMTIVYGETVCRGFQEDVDTSSAEYTLSQETIGIKVVFPIGSFSSAQETTLWLSSTCVNIFHPNIGTTVQKPFKASFPWNLMPFDVTLETGKSATMTIPFMPNVSEERLKWADFRLYRYGWGTDKFDPRDDVVEIVATTEDGTLTVDPIDRVATTSGTGNITKFGKYQLFQVTDDSDNDGLPDAWETYYGETDPAGDNDGGTGDGLTNLGEYQYGCDPDNADTDGDTYEDGWEVANGYDPADKKSHP